MRAGPTLATPFCRASYVPWSRTESDSDLNAGFAYAYQPAFELMYAARSPMVRKFAFVTTNSALLKSMVVTPTTTGTVVVLVLPMLRTTSPPTFQVSLMASYDRCTRMFRVTSTVEYAYASAATAVTAAL